jgi:hypothetical protein
MGISSHYFTMTDTYIGPDGIAIEFVYTRLQNKDWNVKATLVAAQFASVEFYNVTDPQPNTLEELIAHHRMEIFRYLSALGRMVALNLKVDGTYDKQS